MDEQNSRDRVIIRTSVIGILANILLASFKAFVGFMSNSIAIVMDAVNNISDAASSVITIVGTKLAGKEADRKHPFGYGRIEYISAMAISFLVLYAGITAFIESVKKIINPETPDYSTASLVIVAVAVLVKIFLGRYVKSVGEKVNSDSLVNSGEDATLDSVISASTLVAALIYLYFGLSLEAWLGAVIAAVIIKSGLEMLSDTLSKILGERADAALAVAIKKTIAGYPDVRGAYDLVLHNYGPDSYNGSVHIEVPDTMTADELDKMLRRITVDVYHKHDVLLTAIGVYSNNTRDPEIAELREKVREIATANPYVIQMHAFYIDKAEKTLRFDIVISFEAPDRSLVYQDVLTRTQKEFPDYDIQIATDIDFTEILES
ncbi:MAG: cation transporter [Oscillospiraceae bacterium]|nr:cation transporter [Oscillospiraceae bacterium]MBQ5343333.1 cation transporter [Oscillospiraceae bacterium]